MPITNGYCTLAELKARVWPTGTVDTNDDTVMEQVITAVSRHIDSVCGRRFYASAETRYYTPEFADLLFVDDLLSVTTLKTDDDGDRVYETTWAATDYDLEPYNATLESQARPYTQIRTAPNSNYAFPVGQRKGVQLAGSFGFASATPAAIKEACLIQSARIYKRRDAIFGVIGSAEMGQQLVIPKLDPDVAQLLAPFKKMEIGAL